MEPKVLSMLGKTSVTELHSEPNAGILNLGDWHQVLFELSEIVCDILNVHFFDN
jgi:hypothetical protein